MDKINIKIGGKAGEGVKVTGLILAKTLTRFGFSTFAYQEYPSLIRGGHNTFQISFSADQVYSQIKKVDILICLDQATLNLHQNELSKDSLIIHDQGLKIPRLPDHPTSEVRYSGNIGIPLRKIALKNGSPMMINTVGIGAALGLLGLTLSVLNRLLEEIFADKGQAVIKANQQSAKDGWDYVNKNYKDYLLRLDLPKQNKPRMTISGNEALAMGAISAGLKFFSSYPMTPATSILHYLAEKAESCEIIVKQPEDEIACINLACGASFAGARSMVATSGGGFSLMVEGVGLAGMTETPLVLVNSTRPGPSTGMPTWSGQGDLKFMIHCGQDDFPRVVLAPGDAQECFDLARLAFVMAEKYQIPVIILLDKYLSESYYSPFPFAGGWKNKRYSMSHGGKNFQRYLITPSGISPRPWLGDKDAASLTNSYEHDTSGLTTEEVDERAAMMEKRQRKLISLEKEIPEPKIFGPKKAKISLISWGSNKGPILQALTQLSEVNFLHLNWLWPLPAEKITEFIKSAQQIFCLEENITGQLAGLIREQTGFKLKSILKYDGRPFWPEEIVEKLG